MDINWYFTVVFICQERLSVDSFVIVVLFCFSFSTLNIPSYCLLVSIVSDKKSAVYLIVVLLYLKHRFPVAVFNVSLSFNIITVKCICVSIFEFILLGII